MPRILLARHGETDWNLEQRVQGHTDRPLNETGLIQARELGDRLAAEQLVAVYSSDLARARETAVVVASLHGLDVVLDADLREKHFGTWEGLTDSEIQARFPDAVRGSFGDGETTRDVALRAVAAFDRIRARHHAGSVLVVSHGGTLRALLAHLEIPHGPIGNCALFRVDY